MNGSRLKFLERNLAYFPDFTPCPLFKRDQVDVAMDKLLHLGILLRSCLGKCRSDETNRVQENNFKPAIQSAVGPSATFLADRPQCKKLSSKMNCAPFSRTVRLSSKMNCGPFSRTVRLSSKMTCGPFSRTVRHQNFRTETELNQTFQMLPNSKIDQTSSKNYEI